MTFLVFISAGGWAFNILLFPLALLVHTVRDAPRDKKDPYDWHNDPLRPWNYKVKFSSQQIPKDL